MSNQAFPARYSADSKQPLRAGLTELRHSVNVRATMVKETECGYISSAPGPHLCELGAPPLITSLDNQMETQDEQTFIGTGRLSSRNHAVGQESLSTARLHGMDLQIEEIGVPAASSDKVDLKGVPAIKLYNRSQEVASCQFHALSEETVMTAAPAVSVNPNEEVAMRVPGKYQREDLSPC